MSISEFEPNVQKHVMFKSFIYIFRCNGELVGVGGSFIAFYSSDQNSLRISSKWLNVGPEVKFSSVVWCLIPVFGWAYGEST